MIPDFNMASRPLAAGARALLIATFVSVGAVAHAQVQPGTPAPSSAPAPASPASERAAVAPATRASVPVTPGAATSALQLVDGAPSRYIVKPGDTLWSIAARFLKSPWRWHEIWRMNRDQLRNPHRIFPGEVLVLGRGADGQPQLSVDRQAAVEPERPTIRLSPQMRATPIDKEAIPAIPPAIIDPFLTKPLVIDRDGLETSAKIVGSNDTRVVLAAGYKIYAINLDEKAGGRWQIYRPGKALSSPGRPEVLGYEAIYLGDAIVDKFGEVSTLTIISANQEIVIGDRLIQAPREQIISYPPHAPDRTVDGRVIAMPSSLIEAGRNAVITLDVGAREGIEIGHVLALHHAPGTIDVWDQKNPYTMQPDKRTLRLPDERIGLAFVFRVFDRVSYALVLNTTKQVVIGDWVHKP